MPAKGQTCANCSGNCCLGLAFIGNSREKLKERDLDNSFLEIKKLGYREEFRKNFICEYKINGECSIYGNRPLLCRTYYCYGKYWGAKRTEKVLLKIF